MVRIAGPNPVTWVNITSGNFTTEIFFRNTQGTLNYQSRIHKFSIAFKPAPNATIAKPAGNNLVFTYLDSTLLYAPDGTTPTTGLDADVSGHLSYPGFPDLPAATIIGDGWGGPGPGGKRPAIDGEGLALGVNGTFWISDEYGPYAYNFDSNGKMLAAIRPNDASMYSSPSSNLPH
jgi:hypothetical protein